MSLQAPLWTLPCHAEFTIVDLMLSSSSRTRGRSWNTWTQTPLYSCLTQPRSRSSNPLMLVSAGEKRHRLGNSSWPTSTSHSCEREPDSSPLWSFGTYCSTRTLFFKPRLTSENPSSRALPNGRNTSETFTDSSLVVHRTSTVIEERWANLSITEP